MQVGKLIMATRLIWLIVILSVLNPVMAVERVALVIGNNDYNVRPLKNPVNDASAVSKLLSGLDFKVISAFDAGKSKIDNALYQFGEAAENAEIALIYYAGHGIQVDGANYLIPVDAKVKKRRDLRKLVKLNDFVSEASLAKSLGLVILDACRDNPFGDALTKTLGRNIGGRGLARVESTQGNTLVAFATKEDSIAQDGAGRHSPYATALLNNLPRKNVEIRLMFGQIRDDVMRATSNVQQPYTYGSLSGKPIYLGGGGSGSGNEDSAFWQSMKRCGTQGCIQAYLDRFPNGKYKNEARRARTQVAAIDTRPPPAPGPDRQAFEPELVTIRGGSFQMGCVSGIDCNDDERVHSVRVGDFQLGKTEVTKGQFRVFVETTGYRTTAEKEGSDNTWRSNKSFNQGEDHPVIYVSWHDAVAYTEWLSQETGKEYRLPTEAEWEYAARAGSSTAYPWGNEIDCNKANYNGGEGSSCYYKPGGQLKGTSAVGSFPSNGYGLKDMIGNVWEWTCSAYDKSYEGSEKVCVGKNDAGRRALRGGSWDFGPGFLRSADRDGYYPASRYYYSGFRVARTN